MTDLTGKAVFLTGAAKGMGRAITLELAAAGITELRAAQDGAIASAGD